MALTLDERKLVHSAFANGPAALVEAGMDADRATIFLSRIDVQAEWGVLSREFDNQEILWGHTKFVAKRNLSRLGGTATDILAQALAGPQFMRAPDGSIAVDGEGRFIFTRVEVSPIQLKAAQDVLERLEVSGRVRDDVTGKLNIKVLFEKDRSGEAHIEIDPNLKTEEQRALSRERIRNTIEVLREALPGLKVQADKIIEADARPPSRRGKKANASVPVPTVKRKKPVLQPTKKVKRPTRKKARSAK